jgi:hypothetical protein
MSRWQLSEKYIPIAGASGRRLAAGFVMGFGCRPRWLLHTYQGRRPKAGKERNRGKWGTRASRGRCGNWLAWSVRRRAGATDNDAESERWSTD